MNNYSISLKKIDDLNSEVTVTCSWTVRSQTYSDTLNKAREILEALQGERKKDTPLRPAEPEKSSANVQPSYVVSAQGNFTVKPQVAVVAPSQEHAPGPRVATIESTQNVYAGATAIPEKRKRGRPSKAELAARAAALGVPVVGAVHAVPVATPVGTPSEATAIPEKRKRGRPSKAELAARAAAVVSAGAGLVGDPNSTRQLTPTAPAAPGKVTSTQDDFYEEEEELDEDELAEPDDDDDLGGDTDDDDSDDEPPARPAKVGAGSQQAQPAKLDTRSSNFQASRKWDDEDDEDVDEDEDDDEEQKPAQPAPTARPAPRQVTSAQGWLPEVSEEDTPNFAAAIELCVKQCIDKGIRDPLKVKELTIKAVERAGYTKYTKVPAFTDYVSPLILRKIEKFAKEA